MRALFITAAALTAAIILAGCPNKKPEPVPGPQSATVPGGASAGRAPPSTMADARAPDERGASEISWFQGTLEEGFSRRHCSERQRWLRY
jgi:hypothetical protein